MAREAVRRGLAPIMAGRNRATIESLASELGLESWGFNLDSHQTNIDALRDVSVVLHYIQAAIGSPPNLTNRRSSRLQRLCDRQKGFYFRGYRAGGCLMQGAGRLQARIAH